MDGGTKGGWDCKREGGREGGRRDGQTDRLRNRGTRG